MVVRVREEREREEPRSCGITKLISPLLFAFPLNLNPLECSKVEAIVIEKGFLASFLDTNEPIQRIWRQNNNNNTSKDDEIYGSMFDGIIAVRMRKRELQVRELDS